MTKNILSRIELVKKSDFNTGKCYNIDPLKNMFVSAIKSAHDQIEFNLISRHICTRKFSSMHVNIWKFQNVNFRMFSNPLR